MRYGLPHIFILIAMLMTTSATQADVIIDITGTPGSGTTTWTFSGSATVGGAGPIIIDDDDSDVSFGWNVGAAFYSGSNTNIDFSATTATFSAGGVPYTIFGIGAVDGFSSPADFGIAIDDATPTEFNYSFASGTALTSFSGSGTAAVDINDFASGSTSATNWGFGSTIQGTLPVTFNNNATAIPEPSSLLLLAMACGAAGVRARRRKKSTSDESLES